MSSLDLKRFLAALLFLPAVFREDLPAQPASASGATTAAAPLEPAAGPGYLLLPTREFNQTPVWGPPAQQVPAPQPQQPQRPQQPQQPAQSAPEPQASYAAPSASAPHISSYGAGMLPPEQTRPGGGGGGASGTIYAPAGPQVKYFGTGGSGGGGGPPPLPSALPSAPGTYKLKSISGDRLYLESGVRAKLAGIVFPEGDAGNVTRSAVKEIVRLKSLILEKAEGSPPRGDRDYEVWAYLPDGNMLNLELVRRGVAVVSEQASFRTTEEEVQFREAQSDARLAGSGFWGE